MSRTTPPPEPAAPWPTSLGRPPRRILILKPCCLGDVLLATPLAAALRAAWPESHLAWAVGAHSRPALLGNPHVDALLPLDGCLRADLSARRFLAGARRLRAERFDLVLVPDRSPLLGLLALASGAPLRLGLGQGWRALPYHRALPAPWSPPRHEALLYLDLAAALGLPPPRPLRPVFVPAAEARRTAAALLAEAPGPAEAPFLVVHPGGGINPGMSLLAKRWPAERFAAAAGRLAEQQGARILLLGATGDAAAAAAFRLALPPAAGARLLDLSGRLDLGQAAACIAAGRLYLGNDSGLAHLATAVGTPALVLFGPTDPARYGPLPGCGLALSPPGAAPGQALRGLEGSTAILDLDVDQVAAAAQALWAAAGGQAGRGGRS